jgi:hypothetical protein
LDATFAALAPTGCIWNRCKAAIATKLEIIRPGVFAGSMRRFVHSLATLLLSATMAQAAQDDLAINAPVLTLDWPAVQIGIASHEDDPTGLTISKFPDRLPSVR